MNSQLLESPAANKVIARWLLGIIALGVLLRLGAAFYMGNAVEALPGIFDQISYDRLAQNVVDGNGFSFDADWWPVTRAGEPTAHWSYFMTLYLAAVYRLFGHYPLVARLIQAVLAGVLMPLFTYRLARRLGNDWLGLLAAAISAIYIYFFYYAAALMTETFFFLAVLGMLNAALSLAEKPGWKPAAWLGLALGCGVLLRQLLLLILPFLLAWLLWAAGKRLKWQHLAIVLGIPVLMILPFTIRNYLVFDQFVLLNTNAGYAFFWANHPIHGTSFFSILPAEYPSYRELIPAELLSLDEAALDKALMQRGIGFVLDDPLRYILLSINRLKDYLLFWPKASSGLLSNLSRVGSFGLFLPFMVYGLVFSLLPGRLERLFGGAVDRKAYLLIYLFILAFSGVHLLSWAYVRYRLPVDTVLIVFAALALYHLANRWLSRPRPA